MLVAYRQSMRYTVVAVNVIHLIVSIIIVIILVSGNRYRRHFGSAKLAILHPPSNPDSSKAVGYANPRCGCNL